MHQIAQKLMVEKRPSAYVNNWDASHVHCILTNEKYVGDVLMQKKYTVDHLTHRGSQEQRPCAAQLLCTGSSHAHCEPEAV